MKKHYKHIKNFHASERHKKKLINCIVFTRDMTWEEKLEDAIIVLYFYQNTYPSAWTISKFLGRLSNNLNGRECKLRTKIFKKLGIKKKVNNYV